MKKEKLLNVGLWLIVGYAVALLTYCTFYFVLNKSDAYISAFGSILSAIATFSASFVAIYLFNDWKDQHNKTVLAHEAKEVHKKFNQFPLTIIEYFLVANDMTDMQNNSDELLASFEKVINSNQLLVVDLINFASLSKVNEIQDLIDALNQKISEQYEILHSVVTQTSPDVNTYKENATQFKEDILGVVDSINSLLHTFIFLR